MTVWHLTWALIGVVLLAVVAVLAIDAVAHRRRLRRWRESSLKEYGR